MDIHVDGSSDENPKLDSGLSCLLLILNYLKVSASSDQLRHATGTGSQGMTAQDIVRATKQLGVRARKKSVKIEALQGLPLPAIGADTDGNFFILAQVSDDKVLTQSPLEESPRVFELAEFGAYWSGELILMTTRESVVGQARRFDVSWFIPALVRYRGLLGEVLAASFFLQLLALLTPIFFQVVIDKVLVHKGLTTLDVMMLGLVVVSVFEVLMGGLRTYVFSHTTNRVDVELSSKLFRHLLQLPLGYFQSRRVGDSVARVRELETIREFLTSSSVTLFIDFFFIFVFLGVMYLYSPTLLIIVLISLPLYILVSALITPPLRRRLDEKFQRGAENQAFLVESVTGVETLKAMAVEPQMQRKWEQQVAGYVATSFQANMLGNWGSQSVQLINKLTTAAILFFGATLAIAGTITVGQLVAFNMLASRVSQPVLRLAQLWQDFQQARISVQRLGDILNTPTEPQAQAGRSNLPAVRGAIEFDKITFRYRPDGREVLRDLSLSIAPGEMLGIVGPSGSGKSTLTKLLQRLYVPQSGRVLVDGIDLAMVDPAWLRRQVGVVLQENILFNRSVRENIALADPVLPMERVV
ncbi:MAG: type I secretion system permease/ATPase, partial [Pseudomonadota bacterium]